MDIKENDLEIEELKEGINSFRKILQPYQRPLLYIGVSICLLLLFFVAFAMGGVTICNQVDGFLDDKFKCHVDYYDQLEEQQNNPQIEIPKFIMEE